MQSGSSPTLDSNAAIPPEIRPSDPRHLGNLTKKMGLINSQVASDTKYDPAPPPRVDRNGNPVNEEFSSELSGAPLNVTDTKLLDEMLYAVGACGLIILVAIAVVIIDPSLRKQAASLQYGYYFLATASAFSVATLYVVYISRKQNNIDMWYK